MVKRTDESNVTVSLNLYPQHFEVGIQLGNRPHRNIQRLSNVDRDAAALATSPITTKQRVAADLNTTVGVLLLQMRLRNQANIDIVANQLTRQLLDYIRFDDRRRVEHIRGRRQRR